MHLIHGLYLYWKAGLPEVRHTDQVVVVSESGGGGRIGVVLPEGRAQGEGEPWQPGQRLLELVSITDHWWTPGTTGWTAEVAQGAGPVAGDPLIMPARARLVYGPGVSVDYPPFWKQLNGTVPALQVARVQARESVPAPGTPLGPCFVGNDIFWGVRGTVVRYEVQGFEHAEDTAGAALRVHVLEHADGILLTVAAGRAGAQIAMSTPGPEDRVWYEVQSPNSGSPLVRVVSTPTVKFEARAVDFPLGSFGTFRGIARTSVTQNPAQVLSTLFRFERTYDSTDAIDAERFDGVQDGTAIARLFPAIGLPWPADLQTVAWMPPYKSQTIALVARMFGVHEVYVEFAAAVAFGLVPLAGDALDLGELLNSAVTGRDLSGQQVGTVQLWLMGLGALFTGATVVGKAIKLLRIRAAASDVARLQDFIDELEGSLPADELPAMMPLLTKLREARDPTTIASVLDRAGEIPVGELRRMFDFIRQFAPSILIAEARIGLRLIIARGGFTDSFIQARYRLSGSQLQPRAWLREIYARGVDQLDAVESAVIRRVENALGREMARLELLPGEEVAEYMSLLDRLQSPGPRGLGLDWDYDRFGMPPDSFPWRPGRPLNLPVIPQSGTRAGRKLIPDWGRSNSESKAALRRAWQNLYYFELLKRAAAGPTAPGPMEVPGEIARLMPAASRYLDSIEDAVPDIATDTPVAELPRVVFAGLDAINPIAQLPDWFLQYELYRLARNPGGVALLANDYRAGRALGAPELYKASELVEEFVDEGGRIVVRNKVNVRGRWVSQRLLASAMEFDHDSVPRVAINIAEAALPGLADQIRWVMGKASALNLRAVPRLAHSVVDASARAANNPYGLAARVMDQTHLRFLAMLDDATLDWLMTHAPVDAVTPAQRALNFMLNQEIVSRGLSETMLREMAEPPYSWPRNFRPAAEEILEDLVGQ